VAVSQRTTTNHLPKCSYRKTGELAERLMTCLTKNEDLSDGGVNGGKSDGLADLGVELAKNIAFRTIIAYSIPGRLGLAWIRDREDCSSGTFNRCTSNLSARLPDYLSGVQKLRTTG